MKTQRERDAEKRQEKLQDIDDAVDEGRLVIRQMTPQERKANPPKERPPRRERGR